MYSDISGLRVVAIEWHSIEASQSMLNTRVEWGKIIMRVITIIPLGSNVMPQVSL